MIQHLNPNTLSIHPLAMQLPRLKREGREFHAILSSIASAGVQEPLKISKGSVADGRERLGAVLLLGYDTVPCIEIPESEVALCILHTLIARKHYSVGARAYLAFPLVDSVLKEAKARQTANLKAGKSRNALLDLRATSCNTAEDLADNLNLGRTTLFAVRNIHGHFAKEPSLREHFEPLILSGELGLGAVIQGIAGWQSTAGKPREDRDQMLLWDSKIKGFLDPRKWSGWDKSTPEARQYVREQLMKAIRTSWPADLRDALLSDLGETGGF